MSAINILVPDDIAALLDDVALGINAHSKVRVSAIRIMSECALSPFYASVRDGSFAAGLCDDIAAGKTAIPKSKAKAIRAAICKGGIK